MIFLALTVAAKIAPSTAPAMGWNSWNHFKCNYDENTIKETADKIVSLGLAQVGYVYVNIDDCWSLYDRNSTTNRIMEDPKKFPNGIKAVADYVHSKGLKFGMYSDSGTRTCLNLPGSHGYEEIDAKTFAEWGVDYLKYDNCYTDEKERAVTRYSVMSKELEKLDRTIWFSICNWGQENPWEWAPSISNSWRMSGDIIDRFDSESGSVMNILELIQSIVQYTGPRGFNDADMLEVGNGGMTDTEYKTHFSFWAALKSPLLIGSDLSKIGNGSLEILKNKDVIAVSQDPLRTSIHRDILNLDSEYQIWSGPLSGNRTVLLVLNFASKKQDIMVNLDSLKIRSSGKAYDLWSKKTFDVGSVFNISLESHDTLMITL